MEGGRGGEGEGLRRQKECPQLACARRIEKQLNSYGGDLRKYAAFA